MQLGDFIRSLIQVCTESYSAEYASYYKFSIITIQAMSGINYVSHTLTIYRCRMFHFLNYLIHNFISAFILPPWLLRCRLISSFRIIVAATVSPYQEYLFFKLSILSGLLYLLYPVYLGLIGMPTQTPHVEAIKHAGA